MIQRISFGQNAQQMAAKKSAGLVRKTASDFSPKKLDVDTVQIKRKQEQPVKMGDCEMGDWIHR